MEHMNISILLVGPLTINLDIIYILCYIHEGNDSKENEHNTLLVHYNFPFAF